MSRPNEPDESRDRRAAMLRTAMGPAIAQALADPLVVEVMVNPDGVLRLDRLGEGRLQTEVSLTPGEAFGVGGHRVELVSVGPASGPNYDAEHAVFRLDSGVELISERRIYRASHMPSTESGIHSTWLRDVYVVLGEPRDGRHAVSAYVNPLVEWIWSGGMLIALGVALCLDERRPPGAARTA